MIHTLGAQFVQYASAGTGPLNNRHLPHGVPATGGNQRLQLPHCLSAEGAFVTYPRLSLFLISSLPVSESLHGSGALAVGFSSFVSLFFNVQPSIMIGTNANRNADEKNFCRNHLRE